MSYSYRQMSSPDFYQSIIHKFPKDRSIVFAYKPESILSPNKGPVPNNLMFVVPDIEEWHKENLVLHPHHYSGPTWLLGHRGIVWLQERLGKKMYLNMLLWGEVMVKYQVVSTADFINNLFMWDSFQVAGLLQNPVVIVELDPDQQGRIETAIRTNLRSSLHVALLLLPEKFTEEALFVRVAGLKHVCTTSWRVKQEEMEVEVLKYRELYEDVLKEFEKYLDIRDGMCIQDTSFKTRYFHLTRIPLSVQLEIQTCYKDGKRRDVEEVMEKVTEDYDCEIIVTNAVKNVICRDNHTLLGLVGVWLDRLLR